MGLFFVQHDPACKIFLSRQLENLVQDLYGCNTSASISRIRWFPLAIELSDVTVQEKAACPRWTWTAANVTISSSWLALLFRHILCLDFSFNDVLITSDICRDGTRPLIAFIEHIQKIITPAESAIPCEVSGCRIEGAMVELRDVSGLGFLFSGSFVSSFPDDAARLAVQVKRGTIARNDSAIGSFDARFFCLLPYACGGQADYSLRGACGLDQLGSATVDIMWNASEKKMTVGDRSDPLWLEITGDDDGNIQTHYSINCGTCDSAQSILNFFGCDVMQVSGSCAPIDMQDIPALSGACTVASPRAQKGSCDWEYSIAANRFKLDYTSNSGDEVALAMCNDDQGLRIDMGLNGARAFCRYSADGSLHGDCERDFIHELCRTFSLPFALYGHIVFDALFENDTLGFTFSCDECIAHLKGITAFDGAMTGKGRYEHSTRSLCLYDVQGTGSWGTFEIQHANCCFSDAFTVTFLHCPLMVHDFFFQWHDDVYANLSGSALAMLVNKTVRCWGRFFIDQSSVRANVLSADFQERLWGHSTDSLRELFRVRPDACTERALSFFDAVELDLSFATRSPLDVSTDILQASICANFHITGDLYEPSLWGELQVLDGSLEFPYKPLFIEQGSVTFDSRRTTGPSIMLAARNQIRQYMVSLTATGSLYSPTIELNSLPVLDQEHILTLLIGGSDNGSLLVVAPQVVSQLFESLLFGSAETSSRMKKYLRRLFRPFKNVQITPHLIDEKGRGGLRGAIDVQVTDRLRASIEKNFSLSEDATFEIEYLISWDSAFRVTQNERGDLGAEWETRWRL